MEQRRSVRVAARTTAARRIGPERLDSRSLDRTGGTISGRWRKCNAATDSADYRGWLVGHFIDPDDIRATKDVEIKWGIHPAGEERSGQVTDEYRTTVILLVHGRFRLDLSTESVLVEDEGD